MRKFLLLVCIALTAQLAHAQCEPQFDFGDEPWGVAPDTVTNFVEGQINSVYAQQIDVKVPVDGEPFDAPFEVVVDSASLSQVLGLPAGLDFECNSPLTTPCTFLGGELGCGIISGIPTEAGLFELDIVVMIYFDLFGTPSSLPVAVDGYRIMITDPLSTDNMTAYPDLTMYPNPASSSFELNFESQISEEVTVTVHDIVGKEVLVQERLVRPGINTFEFSTADLNEGTYLVRIEGYGSVTKRLVVSR